MKYLMIAINKSWVWLGPYLLVCLGTALIAQVVEIFRED